MDDLSGRPSRVQQDSHDTADLHHLYRYEEQEASGVQRPQAGDFSPDRRTASACPVRMAVRTSDGNAALYAAAEPYPIHGGFARGSDTGTYSPGQYLQVHQGGPDEGPLQLREREFRAERRDSGEQIQREYPDALLLQGEVPQGMGQYQQPFPRDVGRGNSRLG